MKQNQPQRAGAQSNQYDALIELFKSAERIIIEIINKKIR